MPTSVIAGLYGVAKSWARLRYFSFTFHFHALEKEMATHSSVLAWRIPGTGEPGGLPSMGSRRVGHNWSDLAAAAAAAAGLPVHHQLPEFIQTHVYRISDAIQPYHPPLSPSPPAPNPSQHQSLFQWVNSSMRWPKYWSFSFRIISSKEIPGLISFRMDLLDLLAVQGTFKSLLQHHTSKASIIRCSAFFTVQLSHPYMTTGIAIALTRQTFVGEVMSLLFNMLPRLVIIFLPRSECLLISWLQSLSAVILKPRK